MAPRSCAQQNLCVNPSANPTREQNNLASQGPVQRFNAESDEAPTKAPTPPEAPIPPLIPPFTEDLFTKFMKVFIETTQAQVQALAEPQKRPFKAQTPKTYYDKSHIEYYHFYQ